MEKIAETILKFLRLDGLVNHLTGYVEARIELMKAEVREDVARTVARAVVTFSMMLIGFLVLLFFSIGLAHFMAAYLQSAHLGYWSVAGLYAFVFLLLFLFRKPIYASFEERLTEAIKRKK